jgi:hypothetical protein
MPCPEKFRESLGKFNVDSNTVTQITERNIYAHAPISTDSNMITAYPKIIAFAAEDILSIIMKSCSA